MVPAHPHLERDRNLDGPDGGIDDGRCELQVPHQSGAGVAVHDLLHRTAHVDVDDRGAAVFVQLGRFGHLLRRATGKLHRDRFFDRIPDHLLKRLTRFPDRRLAGDHLGHGEARAITLDDPSERHVGHTRHRRQNDRRLDPYGTDLDGFQAAHRTGEIG